MSLRWPQTGPLRPCRPQRQAVPSLSHLTVCLWGVLHCQDQSPLWISIYLGWRCGWEHLPSAQHPTTNLLGTFEPKKRKMLSRKRGITVQQSSPKYLIGPWSLVRIKGPISLELGHPHPSCKSPPSTTPRPRTSSLDDLLPLTHWNVSLMTRELARLCLGNLALLIRVGDLWQPSQSCFAKLRQKNIQGSKNSSPWHSLMLPTWADTPALQRRIGSPGL